MEKNDSLLPIHVACQRGDIDLVKSLILNKCNIEACTDENVRPIHYACKYGHIEVVNLLISYNCNIEAYTKDRWQPIHYACKNGHVDVVNILISYNCNIEALTKDGMRPIHYACKKDNVDVVSALIEKKCNIKACTEKGESPIDLARNMNCQKIIDILCDAERIDLIAQAMDIKCTTDCDHDFCRKTLDSKQFKKGQLIGSGAVGKAYRYKISQTNREIVIKRTKFISDENKYIEENINKYGPVIVHKNIVRYFGALKISGKLCIYMEYMPGGSLENYIEKVKCIPYNKVIEYSKQILEGLAFLHEKGIIHRDMKPSNILLDDQGTLKISDFGLSKSLRIASTSNTNVKTTTCCGTPNYIAPEIINDEPYDFPADVWSTGATVIQMITGKMPYHGKSPEAVIFKIGLMKKIEFVPNKPISNDMRSFINEMLTPEQSKRPTAQFLLNHQIFKN